MEEKRLLNKLKRKDPDALVKVIHQYSGYVVAIIRNIVGDNLSTQDIEELSSDVFYIIWEQAERIENGKLKAYISKVARYKAIDRVRNQKVEILLEEDNLCEIQDKDIPDQLLLKSELRTVVMQALFSMGCPEREIFLRHYYYCQTVQNIAFEMNMNISTVKSKLVRGRKKLKRILQEGGYFDEN